MATRLAASFRALRLRAGFGVEALPPPPPSPLHLDGECEHVTEAWAEQHKLPDFPSEIRAESSYL